VFCLELGKSLFFLTIKGGIFVRLNIEIEIEECLKSEYRTCNRLDEWHKLKKCRLTHGKSSLRTVNAIIF
jgi:hypothetical protein